MCSGIKRITSVFFKPGMYVIFHELLIREQSTERGKLHGAQTIFVYTKRRWSCWLHLACPSFFHTSNWKCSQAQRLSCVAPHWLSEKAQLLLAWWPLQVHPPPWWDPNMMCLLFALYSKTILWCNFQTLPSKCKEESCILTSIHSLNSNLLCANPLRISWFL